MDTILVSMCLDWERVLQDEWGTSRVNSAGTYMNTGMSEWLVEVLVPLLLLDLPMSSLSMMYTATDYDWWRTLPPESKPTCRSLGEQPFILKTAEIVKSVSSIRRLSTNHGCLVRIQCGGLEASVLVNKYLLFVWRNSTVSGRASACVLIGRLSDSAPTAVSEVGWWPPRLWLEETWKSAGYPVSDWSSLHVNRFDQG